MGWYSIKKFGVHVSFVMGMVIFMGAGCVHTNNPPSQENNFSKLFVVESDFQTGVLQWMGPESDSLASGYFQIFQDSRIYQYNGMLYVLEGKGADNIIKFDPKQESQSGIMYQQHLGKNWNPIDIEFANDQKAYISCENNPAITIFNPSSGSLVGTIDISKYSYVPDSGAPETNPHAYKMALENNKLYAGLQRLDKKFGPGFNSLVLVIDVVRDSIIDTIQLHSKNLQDLKVVDGKLYASCPNEAWMTIGDGDVEVVDLATRIVTTVIDETTLKGNPLLFVHKSGSLFYVQTYIGWQNVQVFEVDFATGKVVDSVPDVINAYGGVFFDKTDSLLFIGEQGGATTPAAEIKIYKNNKLVRRVNGKLPPYGFELIQL